LLPLGGGLLLGGGVPDVDGGVDGVFGFVGGVDCVGQFALASITDPSGHVFVVGGVDVDGVNDWVHEGSVGFFVQSTGGAVPEVQLPAAHVVPLPFPPPDIGIDVLLGCSAAEVLLGGLNIIDDMLDGFVKFVDVVLVALMGIVAFARLVVLVLGITVNVAELEVGL
jgi:hypothetical protein